MCQVGKRTQVASSFSSCTCTGLGQDGAACTERLEEWRGGPQYPSEIKDVGYCTVCRKWPRPLPLPLPLPPSLCKCLWDSARGCVYAAQWSDMMETSGWQTSAKNTPGHAQVCGPGGTTGAIVYAVSRALSIARKTFPKKWLTLSKRNVHAHPRTGNKGLENMEQGRLALQCTSLQIGKRRVNIWELRRSDSPCGYATSRPTFAFMQPAQKSLHDIPRKLQETLERLEINFSVQTHMRVALGDMFYWWITMLI